MCSLCQSPACHLTLGLPHSPAALLPRLGTPEQPGSKTSQEPVLGPEAICFKDRNSQGQISPVKPGPSPLCLSISVSASILCLPPSSQLTQSLSDWW